MQKKGAIKMKSKRHEYYNKLEKDENLLGDVQFMREAMLCSMKDIDWQVSDENLDTVINNKNHKREDFLKFISLVHSTVSDELRRLEGID